MVREKTGLLIDAYFSGTKVKLDPRSCRRCTRACGKGELLFGTIDTWLIWNLTGGKVHVTDVHQRLAHVDVRHPRARLGRRAAEDARCSARHAAAVRRAARSTATPWPQYFFGREVPIAGVAGDQQAALVRAGLLRARHGQEHLRHRLFHADEHRREGGASKNGLLTTIAWGIDGKVEYALEGSIFVAGSVIQWLRDGLRMLGKASDSQAYAERATTAMACISCRRSSVSVRRTGAAMCAARVRIVTRHDEGAVHSRRARVDGLPDARRAGCDGNRFRHR
jgi:glycerol kinase